MRRAVAVVGIGDDGCAGLSARGAGAVARAQVLVGGERHLAFFPQFTGRRIALRGSLTAALEEVRALADEHDVCVLASGDPLFHGIGRRVVEAVGAEHVEIVPHVTCVQEAFARLGLSWQDAAVISVHGRPLAGLAARLRRLAKAAVLTDPENDPPAIARHLLEYGEAGWIAHLCEDLGGPSERVRRLELPALACATGSSALSVLVLLRPPTWRPPATIGFLEEAAFARRMPREGLITKREARLLSLAALALRPGDVVWDVGAGSGSVGIEAAHLAFEGHVHLVEVDPEGVELCRANLRAHGADNATVVAGRAPEALAGLPAPDAVFVGGSKGSLAEILDAAHERLRPGGRLVVNAVTLENVAEAHGWCKRRGLAPDVTLLGVSRGAPLAGYLRYEAQNPIHVFALRKVGAGEGA